MTAAEALVTAVMTALQGLEGVGVYDGTPVRASFPYATVEAGAETDWSHKSGAGRELRIAVTLHDRGERPTRLRRLVGEVEASLAALGDVTGWHLVTLHHLRSRLVREARGSEPRGWVGAVEFRARLMALEAG